MSPSCNCQIELPSTIHGRTTICSFLCCIVLCGRLQARVAGQQSRFDQLTAKNINVRHALGIFSAGGVLACTLDCCEPEKCGSKHMVVANMAGSNRKKMAKATPFRRKITLCRRCSCGFGQLLRVPYCHHQCGGGRWGRLTAVRRASSR